MQISHSDGTSKRLRKVLIISTAPDNVMEPRGFFNPLMGYRKYLQTESIML